MPQSQWIILFAAATVAAIVLVRLYLVLGRRGAQPPQDKMQARAPQNRPQSLAAPPPALVEASSGGLLDIQLADHEFDTAKFLEGARAAYALILRAFESGDRAALQPLVSGEVHDAFGAAIDARGDASMPFHFATIKEARITAAVVDAGKMEITIAFTASFEPPVGAPHDVTDVWTFARQAGAADPNWTLVATSGEMQ